jgi:hypothetical protein
MLQMFRFVFISVLAFVVIKLNAEESVMNYGGGYEQVINFPPISSANVKLITETEKCSFNYAELLQMELYLQNVSKNIGRVIYSDLQIIVQYNDDNSIKIPPLRCNETEYSLWKYQKWRSGFSRINSRVIEADKKLLLSSVHLNNLFDMTLEGTYNVFVTTSFEVFSTTQIDKIDIIKSNTLKLVIANNDFTQSIKFFDKKLSVTKPSHGISFLLVSDNLRYDNYGPVYFRIATKNVSDNPISMIVDTKNIFDVYDLVLLTPGGNRDFRKPAAKDKSDVKKVDYTLYGQKLLSEKSKTPKPVVAVKPNEETAESVIVLNRIFDMSTDGIYGLIVTKKIIDANGKEQTISSEPFPIRIGQSLTQDEIDESVRQRRLNGYDPDYPTWQSRDGLFKVIAKFSSVDKDIVTLEKIDGKKITFNISDLTKENQNYIKEQTQKILNHTLNN